MSLDRYDDDNRQKVERKTIVLSDGREFSHKHVFDTLRTSGLKEPYMREALYKLLRAVPISIDTRPVVGDTIDVERFFKRHSKDRSRSREVKVLLNGIDSNNPKFSEVLLAHGQSFSFK